MTFTVDTTTTTLISLHFLVNSMVWLFWLLTLNSVVNPWIYMMFNVNLVESLYRVCCPFDPEAEEAGGGGGGCACLGGEGRRGSRRYMAKYQGRGNNAPVSTTYTTGE